MSLTDAMVTLVESADVGFHRQQHNITVDAPLPNSPDRGVRLRVYTGLAPRYIHGLNGPAYMLPRVQVLIRGVPHNAIEPEQDAYTLFYALAGVGNQTVDGVKIVSIVALDYPIFLETDGNQRRSYVFNLQINEGRM